MPVTKTHLSSEIYKQGAVKGLPMSTTREKDRERRERDRDRERSREYQRGRSINRDFPFCLFSKQSKKPFYVFLNSKNYINVYKNPKP